jgi:hypothetical protein
LVVAALISFAILPARIRRFQEDEPQVGAPEMAAAATGVAD